MNATRTDEKYLEPKYTVYSLYSATFNPTFSFSDGLQTVTKNNISSIIPILYPSNNLYEPTDLTQLSYAGVFWAFSDLLVGTMALIMNTLENGTATLDCSSIASNIEHTSLLGSNDLDYFFDLNSEVNSTYTTEYSLSPHRILDKALAQNQTLPFLINQLSFNVTVSMLTDLLLRQVGMS